MLYQQNSGSDWKDKLILVDIIYTLVVSVIGISAIKPELFVPKVIVIQV